MVVQQLDLPDDLRVSLEAAVQAIVRIADPELVILFGSWAEGRAREGSDVDLLVVAETEDRIALEVQLEDALEQAVGTCGFDFMVVPADAWPRARRLVGFVTYEADRHGVTVYERAA